MKTRMMSGSAIGLVLVAGMAATTAFAHDNDKMRDSTSMMNSMDTNHDGMISAEEHAAHAKMMFDKMDTNHDGMISKSEMEAGMKMMHEEHERNEHMMKDGHEMKEDANEKKEDMDDKK